LRIERIGLLIGRGVSDDLLEYIRHCIDLHGLKLSMNSLSGVDIVLVIGSDRDILDAIQLMSDKPVPLLGVSPSSQVSYLSSITIEELDEALSSLSRGYFEIANYARLKGVINGSSVLYAVNEIAVFPSKSATLMSYELEVNGELVWRDRSDGILIATPIGSTAYALSAGGAVILEESPVIEVVPVNSLDPSKRPLIVPDSSQITVKNISSKYLCEAIADGSRRIKVHREITITKAEAPAKIIRITSKPSVKEALKEKMKLEELIDMPPSAKYVLKILELKGPLTVKEISEITLLPERTVRYALTELTKKGLVKRRISLRDARQVYYEPSI